MKFETKLIHSGQEADKQTGSVTVPIYQTSTYKQDAIGKDRGWEYSRTGNPTRKALEDCIADLEGAKYGLAFASGMSAETAILSILKSGDHIISGDDIYGGTYRLFEKVYKKWGLEISYADSKEPSAFKKEIRKNTKLIWIETPTNPLLNIIDIKEISEIAKNSKAILVVDNTFATPYFQRPIELGADIVIHSSTKYLGGHSDVVGGVVITSNLKLYESIKFYQNAAGAVPGPWDAWLVLRGIKTLAVRMKKHQENAFLIAEFLKGHKDINKLYYPGLKDHSGYEIAKKQMSGFGGMLSFELKGGFKSADIFLKNLKVFTLAESLGGVESLACYPPTMTHSSVLERERIKRGITDGLVRLSVGIEDSYDLINDIKQAINYI